MQPHLHKSFQIFVNPFRSGFCQSVPIRVLSIRSDPGFVNPFRSVSDPGFVDAGREMRVENMLRDRSLFMVGGGTEEKCFLLTQPLKSKKFDYPTSNIN